MEPDSASPEVPSPPCILSLSLVLALCGCLLDFNARLLPKSLLDAR